MSSFFSRCLLLMRGWLMAHKRMFWHGKFIGNLWETYGKLNKEERTTNFDFGYLSTSDCMSCCFTQFSELPFQQPNFNENLLVWESSGNPSKIEESHKFSISNHWFRKKVNASSLHADDVPCSSSCGCMWVHGTQNDVLVWETYGKPMGNYTKQKRTTLL